MKITLLSLLFILFISGCANQVSPFSPGRINQNQGKINQNGLMTELGKLQGEMDAIQSNLEEIQNGLLNINSAISRNENNGVQILQGDGSLILIFSLISVGMILFYRSKSIENENKFKILTKEVVKYNDAKLNDNIIKSAIKQKKEKNILEAMKKEL